MSLYLGIFATTIFVIPENNKRSHCILYIIKITQQQESTHWKKMLMLGKFEGRKSRGMTEDEMVGWNHWLKGHESEQTPGDGERQRSLVCWSRWGHKE